MFQYCKVRRRCLFSCFVVVFHVFFAFSQSIPSFIEVFLSLNLFYAALFFIECAEPRWVSFILKCWYCELCLYVSVCTAFNDRLSFGTASSVKCRIDKITTLKQSPVDAHDVIVHSRCTRMLYVQWEGQDRERISFDHRTITLALEQDLYVIYYVLRLFH